MSAGRYESSQKLMGLVKHAESDAWLSLGLCFYLNVLPLTRQLSNLSGSLWSKALQGQRAQRIEMLLLHEFYQRKFMLPDRLTIKVGMIPMLKPSDTKISSPSRLCMLMLSPRLTIKVSMLSLLRPSNAQTND